VAACIVVAMTTQNPLGRPEDSVPESAPLSRTVKDVDDALLTEAQLLLGSGTENDTVNLALAGLITEQRRNGAVESQLTRFRSGQFAVLGRNCAGRP
jgi:Arc/MetJ family transcription regulator